jgi:alkylation response protein AidB-like acyl-CoA dehydrogenase
VHDALRRLVEGQAAAGAAAGRLTGEVVAGLRAAGLFKLYLPAELGGLGAGLAEGCRTIAEVSEADTAAGWAVMIGAGPNWFAGRMAPALAEEVFGPADSVVAGSGAVGRARPAGDGDGEGWRVSGRWRWCSGAPWATWFTFNAKVEAPGAGGPGEGPGGRPLPDFTFAVPAADVRLHPDTWDVRGLRATASWDVSLEDVFVPTARTFQLGDPAPLRPEPVFAVPFIPFAQATIASVSVGGARRALRAFAELARTKTPAFADDVVAHDRAVADRYARATAEVRAAAAYLEAAIAGRDGLDDVDIALAANHAASTGTAIARALWDDAGMSVLPDDSALGRVIVDLQAAAQNAVVATGRYAELGAGLLGGVA